MATSHQLDSESQAQAVAAKTRNTTPSPPPPPAAAAVAGSEGDSEHRRHSQDSDVKGSDVLIHHSSMTDHVIQIYLTLHPTSTDDGSSDSSDEDECCEEIQVTEGVHIREFSLPSPAPGEPPVHFTAEVTVHFRAGVYAVLVQLEESNISLVASSHGATSSR